MELRQAPQRHRMREDEKEREWERKRQIGWGPQNMRNDMLVNSLDILFIPYILDLKLKTPAT